MSIYLPKCKKCGWNGTCAEADFSARSGGIYAGVREWRCPRCHALLVCEVDDPLEMSEPEPAYDRP